MAIYALGTQIPVIHPDAYIHPEAVIIGEVTVGAESTVWAGAVLRGDDGAIVVGERTSVQDNAVIHTTPSWPTIVGHEVTIGHLAHLEGCVVHDGALIGSGSVVLHRAVIGSSALVAANAVVLADTEVPPGALAIGTPATIRLDAADPAMMHSGMRSYVDRGHRYRAGLRRLE